MGKVVALLPPPPPKLLSFATFITRIAFQLDAYRPLVYRISQHALHRGGAALPGGGLPCQGGGGSPCQGVSPCGGICLARWGCAVPGGSTLPGGSPCQGGGGISACNEEDPLL